MKNNTIRMNMSLLCLLFCVLFSTLTVVAAVVVYGSEAKGYLVSANQLRKNTVTFDDSKLNATYKGYTNSAVARWKATNVITFKRDKSSRNKVLTYSAPNSGATAYTKSIFSTVDGRIVEFSVNYNKAYMNKKSAKQNRGTATHEFGHTMGLMDLYNTSNRSKNIMYGVSDRTVYVPSSNDIKGAKYATRK